MADRRKEGDPDDRRDLTVYLGIDPGAGGGLAVIDGTRVRLTPMPATEKDLWEWFEIWDPLLDPEEPLSVHACLEQVGGYLKPVGTAAEATATGWAGGGAANGTAMFRFGTSYGALRMALTAAGIPWELATPAKWQRALGIPSRKKSETRTQHKNKLKSLAQRLYPQAKVTLQTADALLLAEYARRSRLGYGRISTNAVSNRRENP